MSSIDRLETIDAAIRTAVSLANNLVALRSLASGGRLSGLNARCSLETIRQQAEQLANFAGDALLDPEYPR